MKLWKTLAAAAIFAMAFAAVAQANCGGSHAMKTASNSATSGSR